jgi:hypothetical protein
MARQQKILALLMDKMGDPNAHDIIQLKAAQLATELSTAIYRTSYEGVIKVKNRARDDMDERSYSIPLQSYLTNIIVTLLVASQIIWLCVYKSIRRE